MLLPWSGPRADYGFWRVGQFEGLVLHHGCFHDGMLKEQHARKGAQSLIQTVTWVPRGKPNLKSLERGGGKGQGGAWKYDSSVVNGKNCVRVCGGIRWWWFGWVVLPSLFSLWSQSSYDQRLLPLKAACVSKMTSFKLHHAWQHNAVHCLGAECYIKSGFR